jgi:hypothetical protein
MQLLSNGKKGERHFHHFGGGLRARKGAITEVSSPELQDPISNGKKGLRANV